MKLWVDDLRPPPDETWEWAKTSQEAIGYFEVFGEMGEDIHVMSLDHDLGDGDTARAVVLWLCENGWGEGMTVYVHARNPVGREWLEGMIERYGPGVTR